MSDASEAAEFGANLRRLREGRGMSRATLAALTSLSPETVKKYENGERGVPRTSTCARLAMALSLTDIRDLTGGPVGMPIATGFVPIPAIANVARTIRTAPRAALPTRVPDPFELAQRADGAWLVWHQSPYQRTQLDGTLPQLLLDGHASVRMAEDLPGRRRAAAALTQIYALTLLAIGYVCEADLYWTVLDRVQMFASDADDPVSLALAAWCQGVALRYSAEPHESIVWMRGALAELEPFANSDAAQGGNDSRELLALIGALHLSTATGLAQDGYAGDAWAHWDKADQIAGTMPQGYWQHATVFGRSNVELHGVSIETALSHMGEARGRAEQIDPLSVPSTERCSRLLIDAAVAFHASHDEHGAVNRMQLALQRAPENTRVVPAARSLVMDLQTTRPPSLAAEVTALAEKMQLLPA